MQQILDSYLNAYHLDEPTLSIVLQMNGKTISSETKAGDIIFHQDRIIALRAVEQPASPMQSVNAAMPRDNSEIRHSHPPSRTPSHQTSQASNQTPSRQPLQPINRQVTVLPKESLDEMLVKRVNSRESIPQFGRNQSTLGKGDSKNESDTPEQPAESKIEHETVTARHEPEPQTKTESQEYKPREVENPFTSEDDTSEPKMRGQPLRELGQVAEAERLEAGVKAGVEMLFELQKPLERLKDNSDAQNWLEQIEKTRKEAVKSRTVVGVVGNTGAGKSSVINAM